MTLTGETEVLAERPVNDKSHIDCIRIASALHPEQVAINLPNT